MKFIKKNAAMAILTSGLLMSATSSAEEVLHMYNWSDYIAEDTLANFQKRPVFVLFMMYLIVMNY